MTTLEDRVSWLEGAFRHLMVRMETMPTRDEMRAEIRAETKEAKVRLTKWMVGLAFTTVSVTVALVKLIP